MKRTDENHSFNIHVATLLKGHVQKAILLKEIYGWLCLNLGKKKNIRHGIVWTYMSAAHFGQKFPYMNSRSICRWLTELEKNRWLYSSDFNQKNYDKTKWYTVNFVRYDAAVNSISHTIRQNDQWSRQIDQAIRQNDQRTSQVGQPIPTPKTTPKPINNISKGQIKDLERKNKELLLRLEKLENQKPKTKRKIFIAPTLEAVTEYFKEKLSSAEEAKKYYYHYESNGWKVGKNKMQKWRSSASGWIARNKPAEPKPKSVQPNNEPAAETMFKIFCKHYRNIYEAKYIETESYKMAVAHVTNDLEKFEPNPLAEETFSDVMKKLLKQFPNLYSRTYRDYEKL
jgi:hypothetical protein